MFVSSPLNVVHAGLDILRSELSPSSSESTVAVGRSTLELIEDIYSASETAIEILNDLLHYEHMDSGFQSPFCCLGFIYVLVVISLRNLQVGDELARIGWTVGVEVEVGLHSRGEEQHLAQCD